MNTHTDSLNTHTDVLDTGNTMSNDHNQTDIADSSHADKSQRPTSLVRTKTQRTVHMNQSKPKTLTPTQYPFLSSQAAKLYPQKSTHTSRAVHLYQQHKAMFWVPAEPSGDEVWTRISRATSIPLFPLCIFYL
jgi:hypothetical protein